MNAYLPHDATTAGLVLALLAATLAAGLGITRLRSPRVGRCAAWLLVVLAVAGVERLCDQEPAGFRMLAIIGTLLFAMKAVVTVEAQADGQPRLSPGRWLAFAAAWPGMRPAPFARLGGPPLSGSGDLIRRGLLRLLLGLGLVLLARLVCVYTPSWLARDHAQGLAMLLLLPGLSLILHFGVFNLLAGLWRRAGVDARPLFRAPLLATSLTEFWGRRWNLAFTEMTAVGVYRPLAGWTGRGAATAAAFLFSGLLHELAISLPVKTGFGLPTLYFLLHGGLVLVERGLERAGWPVNRWTWVGRVWTLAWLVLPLPVLFHPAFRAEVVWPLLGLA
jgi:hypothetical protein